MAALGSVKVLRSNALAVTRSDVTSIELSVQYCPGHLRDSDWRLVLHHDALPDKEYTFVCGLKPHLVDALRRLREKAVLGSLERQALVAWFGRQVGLLGVSEDMQDCQILVPVAEMLTLLRSADQSWLDGLFRAIGETYKTDALPAIIEYATATDVLRPVVYSKSVANVLEEAWHRPFEDPVGVVDYLFEQLEGYVESWKERGIYYAAWTVMIQSSGWGKSRTICQLYTKGVYVAYISFMRRGWSGIPSRSAVAALLPSSDGDDPRLIAAWVFSLLFELSDQMKAGKTPEDWMRMQMDVKSAEEIGERVRERYGDWRKHVLDNVSASAPRPGQAWDGAALEMWVGERTKELFGDPKILICIDEAASFFNDVPGSFLATRRFFSCIKRESWMFGMVTDTAGKLGLIYPERMYDPSARAAAAATKFFQPIWLVGNLWGDGKKLLELMNVHQGNDPTIPSEEVSRELFKWGRPLWRSVLERGGSGAEAVLGEVVEFGVQKLLAGRTLEEVKKWLEGPQKKPLTDAMAMAVLGVAAGLEVVAWSDVAKDMVASHMRTVTYIGGERDRVFSADALEPILGEAAARILRHTLSDVLKVALGVFKQAYVVEGPRGEIVGRLIMVLAMHACCWQQPSKKSYNIYSHPVKLGVFLSKLCEVKLEADGLLCFNRFIMLNRKEITRRHLLICFICCVAIIPRRGQEAFDVLLPLLMPQPDGKYKVEEGSMQGLPVQIRNRNSYSVDTRKLASFASQYNSSSSVEKGSEEAEKESGEHDDEEEYWKSESSDDARDPDYVPERKKRRVLAEVKKLEGPLGIYMHLGGRNKSKSHELDQNDKVLILHRTEFGFLESEHLEALEDLRSAFFKIEERLTAKERSIVRHNLSNYMQPTDFSRLTLDDLKKEAAGLGISDEGSKKNLEDRLKGLGLGDPFLALFGAQ